jgi:glycerol uptake facilitator-like aquaporin
VTMAQTKRKRRTKHRGNAAGMVESRGRTGRAPSPSERKSSGRAVRMNRYDRPPTWRSAANRSAIATLMFVVIISVLQKNIVAALAIGVIMFFVYTALGYYTDNYIYRRRQAKKAQGKL